MPSEANEPNLAWFLGPKSENADVLQRAVLDVLAGYSEWRRNYYPNDGVLLSQAAARSMQPSFDGFGDVVTEMMAALRRTFPFHSPRYLGHMQSDTTLASIVGHFAGTLFNPNNVTTESGAVTVGWEIDACAAVLTMLGYTPAPEPPTTRHDEDSYKEKVKAGFGWAHITSGGTAANIEALWAARAIAYFPLAARDAAEELGVDVPVRLPGREASDGQGRNSVRTADEYDLLLMTPAAKIGLLPALILATAEKYPAEEPQAVGERVMSALKTSDRASSSRLIKAMHDYPPVVFASETAHYSVKKAADVLGIGRNNVCAIGTDDMFRLDIKHLEVCLNECREARRVPVAVIGVLGTTEEGSVDPVHEIVKLRSELERSEQPMSFWLHVDGAWGGYFRTLLTLTDRARRAAAALMTATELGVPLESDPIRRFIDVNIVLPPDPTGAGERRDPRVDYLAGLFGEREVDPVTFIPRAVSESVPITSRDYSQTTTLMYGDDPSVIRSLAAVPGAESVTVDPHKMGYVGYPCGVVAFRDDWVRHYLTQDAPYITAVAKDLLDNHPPRHGASPTWPDAQRVKIEAFAPYTLEGSRPGASAVALWLSNKVTPPDIDRHGRLVAGTVIAARELFEWLGRWDDVATANGRRPKFEIVRYTPRPPDTNVVIFGVKPRGSTSLADLNMLTDMAYQRFAIRQEFGESDYPYAQDFFISNTTFRKKQYRTSSVRPLLQRAGIYGNDQLLDNEYEKHGIKTLRATIMNPYLVTLRRTERQYVIRDFVSALHSAIEQAL